MTTISKIRRAAVIEIIRDSREYDAATVRISQDGWVSARKDASKTHEGYDARRYQVGHVDDMVTLEGTRRAGF